MIVEFKFDYLGSNGVLGYFLDFYAQNSGLKYSIVEGNKQISLFVEGEESEILKFGDESMNLIPNSIFLANSEVRIASELPATNHHKMDISLPYFTPRMIKSEKLIPNEFGILSGLAIENHHEITEITETNFDQMLDYAFLQLLHYKNLKFVDEMGVSEMIPAVDFTADFLMPTNLLALSKIFVADEKSLIALAGFEKPIINLKINAVFRQNHPEAPLYFDIKAASDFFIFKLFQKLYENDIFFVSVKSLKKRLKIAVLEDKFLVVNHAKILDSKKLAFLTQNHSNLAHFALICDEFGLQEKVNLHLNFSKTENDSIKLYKNDNEYNLLKIELPKSFGELFAKIRERESGAKLLENYTKEFGRLPSGIITQTPSFYTLFGMISRILFSKSAEWLLQNASDFMGNKGARIDFKIVGKNEFDVLSMICSAMSFKLAGSDEKILSFGILESFVYFLRDYTDTLDDELGFDAMVATGTLFEERKISNLCVKLLGQKLKFSDEIGLSGE